MDNRQWFAIGYGVLLGVALVSLIASWMHWTRPLHKSAFWYYVHYGFNVFGAYYLAQVIYTLIVGITNPFRVLVPLVVCFLLLVSRSLQPGLPPEQLVMSRLWYYLHYALNVLGAYVIIYTIYSLIWGFNNKSYDAIPAVIWLGLWALGKLRPGVKQGKKTAAESAQKHTEERIAHVLLIEQHFLDPGFTASCSCGAKLRTVSIGNSESYDHGRVAAEQDFREHLAKVQALHTEEGVRQG